MQRLVCQTEDQSKSHEVTGSRRSNLRPGRKSQSLSDQPVRRAAWIPAYPDIGWPCTKVTLRRELVLRYSVSAPLPNRKSSRLDQSGNLWWAKDYVRKILPRLPVQSRGKPAKRSEIYWS